MTMTTSPHNLTPGQVQCWVAIADYMEKHGRAPAIADLMEIFNLRSRSLVQGRVDKLKEAGVIETWRNKPRSMRLIEQPPR